MPTQPINVQLYNRDMSHKYIPNRNLFVLGLFASMATQIWVYQHLNTFFLLYGIIRETMSAAYKLQLNKYLSL